jgi:hypothetical protein
VTRLPQARFDEALEWLSACSSWWGGWLRIRLGSWGDEDGVIWRRWPEDVAGMVRWLDEEHDDEVLLGLPWSRKDAGGVAKVSLLWARVEGDKQLAWARRHRPLPTMILQEGTSTRRWLLWALEEPVGWVEAVEANKRLAYRFGGVQKWADPDVLWLPAPGTCLRAGRTRPVPIRVSRVTTATFLAGDVAGGLKDPPQQVWMNG